MKIALSSQSEVQKFKNNAIRRPNVNTLDISMKIIVSGNTVKRDQMYEEMIKIAEIY